MIKIDPIKKIHLVLSLLLKSTTTQLELIGFEQEGRILELKAVFRIRINEFLGLPYPEPAPLVGGTNPDPDPDPSKSSKNSKKNLYFYYFVTSLILFIFEE